MPEPIVAPVAPPEHGQRNINAEHSDRIIPPVVAQPILGKFKDQAALEAAYTEAEKKITEYGTKYKDYDDYSTIGKPSEIKEALDWARNVKTAMERGLLKPAAEAEASRQSNAPAKLPWDDDNWAYKPAGEQAKALAEYTQSEVKKYVDQIASQYGQQIQGLRATDGREKALLLKTLQAVAKNPNLDANEILAEAAQYAQRSPEELLDMVMEARLNTPETRSKEIEEKVAERVAEELQRQESKRYTDILQTSKPKFGRTTATREAENREILNSLAKQGIRF